MIVAARPIGAATTAATSQVPSQRSGVEVCDASTAVRRPNRAHGDTALTGERR
jgi:hypothetical protein